MKTEPEINMGLSYPINFAGSNTVRKKTTAPQQCKTSLDWNLIEHGFGGSSELSVGDRVLSGGCG